MNLNNVNQGVRKRSLVENLFVGLEKYLNGTGTDAENKSTLNLAKQYQSLCLQNGDGEACQAFTEVFNTVCKRSEDNVSAPATTEVKSKAKKGKFLNLLKEECSGKYVCYILEMLSVRSGIKVSTIKNYLSEFKARGCVEYETLGNALTIKYVGD